MVVRTDTFCADGHHASWMAPDSYEKQVGNGYIKIETLYLMVHHCLLVLTESVLLPTAYYSTTGAATGGRVVVFLITCL
jgi:hypothetical protein